MSTSLVPDPIRLIQDVSQQTVFNGAIGIQGGRGSFNEQAICRYLSHKAVSPLPKLEYLYTSDRVGEALVSGEVAFGQCAISNSLGGQVQETFEMLRDYPLEIVATFEIQIAHALMKRPEQDFAAITTVMCHPQVLAQCQKNLSEKYPSLLQTSGQGDLLDSARVAEAVSKRELPDHIAVMGSRDFADLYHLEIIEDNLQDLCENFTRFILVRLA